MIAKRSKAMVHEVRNACCYCYHFGISNDRTETVHLLLCAFSIYTIALLWPQQLMVFALVQFNNFFRNGAFRAFFLIYTGNHCEWHV